MHAMEEKIYIYEEQYIIYKETERLGIWSLNKENGIDMNLTKIESRADSGIYTDMCTLCYKLDKKTGMAPWILNLNIFIANV